MKVKELMERVDSKIPTGRAIAYIIDGLEEINMLAETHINIQRISIEENKRSYSLPPDSIKILDVRAKNHLNQKDEYRTIPRIMYEPKIEDANLISVLEGEISDI